MEQCLTSAIHMLYFLSKSRAITPSNDKEIKMYVIQDREAGNKIDEAKTLDSAQKIVEKHEAEDKSDGSYSVDFYEIKKVE